MKQRLAYLDVAKGIGILLVITGHFFMYRGPLSCVIFSFHMPLFFFVSGLLFRQRDEQSIGCCIAHKAKGLLIPYAVFFLIGLVVTLLIPSARETLTLWDVLTDLYNGCPKHLHNGQIWFLLCLFEVEVIYLLLRRWLFKKGVLWQMLVLLALLVISNELAAIKNILPDNVIPFKLDTAMMGLVFYMLGVWSRELVTGGNFWNQNKWLLPVLAVVVIGFSGTNGWVNMEMTQYNNMFYYLVFALCGTFLVLLLSMLLQKSRFLAYIGRHSLIIFSMHSFALYFFDSVATRLLGKRITGGIEITWVEALVGSVFTLLSMLLLVFVWEKVQLWWAHRHDKKAAPKS